MRIVKPNEPAVVCLTSAVNPKSDQLQRLSSEEEIRSRVSASRGSSMNTSVKHVGMARVIVSHFTVVPVGQANLVRSFMLMCVDIWRNRLFEVCDILCALKMTSQNRASRDFGLRHRQRPKTPQQYYLAVRLAADRRVRFD